MALSDTLIFQWCDPAGRDVAHGQTAMGSRRGRVLLQSAAEVLERFGVRGVSNRALGLAIPPGMLAAADEVLE